MTSTLPPKPQEIINILKKEIGYSEELIIKIIPYPYQNVYLLFIDTLCSQTTINKFILNYFDQDLKKVTKKINLLNHFKTYLPIHKIVTVTNYNDLITFLLSGYPLILIDDSKQALALEAKEQLNSSIQDAKAETIIKGPKDAFTENYQVNLGLIRKRLKTETLWIQEFTVGTKSKTKVGVCYLKDIVDLNLVNYVTNKIKNIDIDAILDSNYIIELISSNQNNVLVDYLSTERPDLVNIHLLNGKIGIVVENTPYVVLIPVVFTDFFHSSEDYYFKSVNVSYTRIIRFIALAITLLTPALYIAITTHNHEAIPEKLLVSFAAQRDGVPFPTIIEALLMLVTFEILKETDLRIPQVLGSALSIVGALVLGQAAVEAGIVSPIMVIVISITAISGLIIPYLEFTHAIRWWRLLLIIAASSFGIVGIFLASIFLIINISSLKSFGKPFLSPIAPLNLNEQSNNIILTNKSKFWRRPRLTAFKNRKRTAGDQSE